jgi:transketolase
MVESHDPDLVHEIEAKATKIRRHIVRMFAVAGHGHFGGSLSCADIISVLYFGGVMRVDPLNPRWPERDRLIISKGHAAPAVYGALVEAGFCPAEWIEQYETLGAHFSTHPNMHLVPGLDFSAGSLGHGLSVGVGMARAGQLDGKGFRVFVILGDGELAEGSNWEAAMAASKYRLANLVAFVDRNHLCVGGTTEQVMPLEPLADKWRAFGWAVQVIDGHSPPAIVRAMASLAKDAPNVVIANTVKGRGISFMENKREWHGHAISQERYEQAMRELGGQCDACRA